MGYLVTAVLEPLVAVILDDAGYVSPRRTLPAAWTGGALMAMAVLLGSAGSADAHTGPHDIGEDCRNKENPDGWCAYSCALLGGHVGQGAECIDYSGDPHNGKCLCYIEEDL